MACSHVAGKGGGGRSAAELCKPGLSVVGMSSRGVHHICTCDQHPYHPPNKPTPRVTAASSVHQFLALCLGVCLQDIVTASPHFSVEGFIPRLRDYLRVTNPYKRQFLISWVSQAGVGGGMCYVMCAVLTTPTCMFDMCSPIAAQSSLCAPVQYAMTYDQSRPIMFLLVQPSYTKIPLVSWCLHAPRPRYCFLHEHPAETTNLCRCLASPLLIILCCAQRSCACLSPPPLPPR
jgi:hypothetical protein